ncbi:hypothetical protein QRO08_09900 [Paracidovorax citrulli]|uniref:Uncharacterized protein n=2 Tax=Paracidovorax citrulli TaxID=80869 RepID=A1TPS6_PARC0|nr:hypothetical protein [Paracidovorax citrulli]ABM32964.1 hypothetical protein Aave_2389 [Paracidovorax citrulli AAC00-1]ATG93071.1 hypothetical protein CQB05_02605 [Paracidovorax citrulli]MVT36760.1 hypothetical protein [Paracidovorax citrulli]PVY67183.1 hypothetical protein C8E08_4618 [Paracidovorax citrulli]REG68654.1 hypothetical protein C8E07_1773 [Paracidovorax citrulli]
MRLVAKHHQVGYQTPGERPGCRNCAHFEVTRHDSPIIAPRTACTLHQLEVTSGGICNSHKLQRKPGEAQLAFLARQRDLLESQAQDLEPRLVDDRVFPAVGEMYEGKPMTVAKHRRLMVEQLITNEEASGDPDLLRAAAFRRRANGMPPRPGDRRA